MKYYLFAKFFQHLTVEQLMECCIEAGLDGPTALVRSGYWISPDSMEDNLKHFTKVAQNYRLDVSYADTGFGLDSIASDDRPLRILADCGVKLIRLGYIKKKATSHVRELFEYSRKLFENGAKIAEKCDIKVIIQLHGGCYPHNATAAYPLVKDLDPEYIGIKIDPGNNIQQEGYEYFNYQIPLLTEYIAAVGAKDACSLRRDCPDNSGKNWVNDFVPAFEGFNNFVEIFSELKKICFNGPLILMPFYDTEDFSVMFNKLKKETVYFKNLEKKYFL